MRHTDDDLDRAAARFEVLADNLDPDTAAVEATDDLQQVAAASEAVRDDEARLQEAVSRARTRPVLEPDCRRPRRVPPGRPPTVR